METWPIHIETSILHLFSNEHACWPCLTHIINQTIINLDITIEYGAVEINNYCFFYNRTDFWDF
jgi:hypothetical protein